MGAPSNSCSRAEHGLHHNGDAFDSETFPLKK